LTSDATDITELIGWPKTRQRYVPSIAMVIPGALFLFLALLIFRHPGWYGLGIAILGVGTYFCLLAVSWAFWMSGHPRLGVIARSNWEFGNSPNWGAYMMWGAGVVLFLLGTWALFPSSGPLAESGYTFTEFCFAFGVAAEALGWVFYYFTPRQISAVVQPSPSRPPEGAIRETPIAVPSQSAPRKALPPLPPESALRPGETLIDRWDFEHDLKHSPLSHLSAIVLLTSERLILLELPLPTLALRIASKWNPAWRPWAKDMGKWYVMLNSKLEGLPEPVLGTQVTPTTIVSGPRILTAGGKNFPVGADPRADGMLTRIRHQWAIANRNKGQPST